MKKIIICLLFIVINLFTIKANIIHTVTSDVLGTSSSLDVILTTAISQAHNNGDNVTIYLDAPGLIKLEQFFPTYTADLLPVINNSNGSITIEPANTIIPQGLKYPGWVNTSYTNLLRGFKIDGNAVNVTIRGLTFDHFVGLNNSIVAIDVVQSSSILIEKCIFENSYEAIRLNTSGTIRVNDCEFETNSTVVASINVSACANLIIENSVFNGVVKGIRTTYSDDLVIENNYFTEVNWAIETILTSYLRIEKNYFYDCNLSIGCEYSPSSLIVSSSLISLQQNRKIHILDNQIIVLNNSTIINSQNRGISVGVNDYCQEVLVENNIVGGAIRQIYFSNVAENNSCAVKINNNSLFNGDYGIILNSPLNSWEIDNNVIDQMDEVGIKANSINDEDGNLMDASVTFVSTNTFGEPLKNANNKIEDCKTSFYIATKSNNLSKIIGYKVDGKIVIDGTYPTRIRENLINISSPDTKPIVLTNDGNKSISSIAFFNLNFNGSSGSLEFILSGTAAGNYGPYKVEFFEMNSDNDLLQLLGTVDASGGQTYTFPFSLSSLSYGTRIGATITSYSGTTYPDGVGTSEVYYYNFSMTTGIACDACGSFKIDPATKYWVSGWVKVDHPDQLISYVDADGPEITVFGTDAGAINHTINLTPEGDIIDGWQRIVGKLEMPSTTEHVFLSLKSDKTYTTYFDDIRIHPFNGSMKSYVYDGETFWLTSELDDNNYATFYEYDNEGGLVRIKKETERGIVTIQETRSHTSTDD